MATAVDLIGKKINTLFITEGPDRVRKLCGISLVGLLYWIIINLFLFLTCLLFDFLHT